MATDSGPRVLSVGGVVLRDHDGEIETVVLRRGETWVLPKGRPVAASESFERTALREVREETGLGVKILAPLGQIHYRFHAEGHEVDKGVLFYLMRVTGGDTEQHDGEYEEVRWVSIEEAERLLSFDNYRELLRGAVSEWTRRRGSART